MSRIVTDKVSQFDNVRIVRTPDTQRLGYADKIGVCSGFTTPSVTGVEVVGAVADDFAFGVHFADLNNPVWFSADLVELVDHAPGTTIGIGDDYSAVRRADGSWQETTPIGKRMRRRLRRLLRG